MVAASERTPALPVFTEPHSFFCCISFHLDQLPDALSSAATKPRGGMGGEEECLLDKRTCDCRLRAGLLNEKSQKSSETHRSAYLL